MSKKMPLDTYSPNLDILAARLVARAPVVTFESARRLGGGSCPCSACRSTRS